MLLNKIQSFIHSKKEGKNCMKQTGITRRIDELGRIVIPKEIRKSMRIKKGELLEIFLSDDDTISLKKYDVISQNQVFLKEYINFLSNKSNMNVYITNLDEIIYSNDENLILEKINNDIEAYLNTKEDFNITNKTKIRYPYDIYLINPNGDLIGYIIFEYLEEKTKFDDEIVKFSALFIQNYLESNQ